MKINSTISFDKEIYYEIKRIMPEKSLSSFVNNASAEYLKKYRENQRIECYKMTAKSPNYKKIGEEVDALMIDHYERLEKEEKFSKDGK